jgi:hypothetical protein
MAGKDHIKASFDQIYELGNFSKNILLEIFGANRADIFKSEFQKDESNNLAASEKKVIQKVLHYGNLTLDDTTTLKLYEITLQSKVRIEQSKVGIQQYIRKNLMSGEGALVNFINPDDKNTWRLTLVASDAVLTNKGITNKKLNAKRYTFIVGASEQNKTISDRFAELEKASRIVLYPSENEKNAVSLVNTFSVEKLSTAFFDEYTLHYKKFVDYLENSGFRKSVFDITHYPNATDKEKDNANKPIRDFVKKMLGRIVFLYFVQKKGWLGATDTDYIDGSDNFIFQLFEKSGADENFYHWLSKLFFKTLNEQRNNDDFKMPDNSNVKIPYLNGGLFDPEEYDNKLLTFPAILFHSDDFEDVILTDKLFKKSDTNHRGFLDFLNAFNFTVHEDSPEDHTVAVDPEMLGHIFENLLEDNKDKGAFYTPKEIVHYMCQESLIEYLNTHLNPKADAKTIKEVYNKQNTNLRIHANQYYEEDYADIQDFVKNKTVNEYILKRAKEVNKFLDNVKICDPAIGSGAFPMGLLQEIFAIKELLAFETNSEWQPAEVKENIIQNSIYGVDIEKGAVDIARLRFWLSLIVNEEKPKALPNLDYKIVVGDSLLSKFGDQVIDIDWDIKSNSDFHKNIKKSIEELVNAKKDFFELKKEKVNAKKDIRTKTIDLLINILTFDKEKYFKEHSKTKSLFELTTKEKKEQADFDNHIYGFDKAIKELQLLKNNNEKFEFFDWKIDFAELLNENFSNNVGFDIIIGNPPYIFSRGNLSSLQKKYYKDKYELTQFKINLYILFIEKSNKILKKENGILFYIIPNNWLTLETNSDLRKNLLENKKDIKILQNFSGVFKNASVDTLILGYKNIGESKISYYEWLDKIPQLKTVIKSENFLKVNNFIINFNNSLATKIEGTILEELCDVKNGVQAYTVGEGTPVCTESMKKVRVYHSNNKIDNDWVKYLEGSDVNRYYLTWGGQYIKYGKNLSRPRQQSLFIGERLLVRQIPNQLPYCINATYSNEYTINDNNSMIIKSLDNRCHIKFILALINSKLLSKWFADYFGKLSRKIFPQFKINELKLFPIKWNTEQDNFVKIVDYILLTKNNNFESLINPLIPTYFEQIIDGMVYELYFPEILKQHNRTIIEHLGELPAFTDTMNDSKKMAIITTVFDRLNEKNHPVRVNLFYMNSIPEIAIIEGTKEESI